MSAVFKREFNAYFSSPIGFVFIAVLYCLSGVFFFVLNLAAGSSEVRYVYSMLFTCTVLLMPILTMRLFSEDKRQKTDQVLLTAPISLFGLVMGKFLAAFVVYVISISITLVFALVLSAVTAVTWSVILGSYLGILLVGAALISLGMFISSLTESQLVAAIVSVCASVCIMLVDSLAGAMPTAGLQNGVMAFSFADRYADFTSGLLDFSHVFFFISFIAVFIFLTMRVFDKRRWG